MQEGSAFHESKLVRTPEATAEEIQRCGRVELIRLYELARRPGVAVDRHLLCSIHRGWFSTTFPEQAGIVRSSMVLNRKGTALAPDALESAIDSACGNWTHRFEAAGGDFGSLERAVSEANEAAIAIYDAHPFIDGNTRTTWHFRNFLLMVPGYSPLLDPIDWRRFEYAWWSATPADHAELDLVTLESLSAEAERWIPSEWRIP